MNMTVMTIVIRTLGYGTRGLRKKDERTAKHGKNWAIQAIALFEITRIMMRVLVVYCYGYWNYNNSSQHTQTEQNFLSNYLTVAA